MGGQALSAEEKQQLVTPARGRPAPGTIGRKDADAQNEGKKIALGPGTADHSALREWPRPALYAWPNRCGYLAHPDVAPGGEHESILEPKRRGANGKCAMSLGSLRNQRGRRFTFPLLLWPSACRQTIPPSANWLVPLKGPAPRKEGRGGRTHKMAVQLPPGLGLIHPPSVPAALRIKNTIDIAAATLSRRHGALSIHQTITHFFSQSGPACPTGPGPNCRLFFFPRAMKTGGWTDHLAQERCCRRNSASSGRYYEN